MKPKHLAVRIEQCLSLAKLSNCCRRQFGALILNPANNTIVGDGYNGNPRGASGCLCGGKVCLRTEMKIVSGTQLQIGCHHAEFNAIANCAANGVATAGMWLIVTGSCCLMCAKLIHHAGIVCVITLANRYSTEEGMQYLKQHGVTIRYVNQDGLDEKWS